MRAEPDCHCFKPPDGVELVVGVYFGQPGPRCDSDAVPPKTVQVIYLHNVPKSYMASQVETSQQNTHGGFHRKTTQFLVVESSFRFISVQWIGQRTPKGASQFLYTPDDAKAETIGKSWLP